VTNSYYSADWQVLEDDIVNGSTATKDTYVWSQSYIDDMVARDQSVNGGAATRIYAQQDANHDVTSITDASGNVLERFDYDPYGTATVLNATTWADRSDGYSWVYRFQGGRYDPSSGKINFRYRDLDTVTGTWMEKDPIGTMFLSGTDAIAWSSELFASGPGAMLQYVDGANLYQFLRSGPGATTDPLGLVAPNLCGRPWSPKDCGKLAADIARKGALLAAEFAKFDPVGDAQGGPTWKRDGHRTEMENLKRGLRDDLANYYNHCGGRGKTPNFAPVWALVNRPIPAPALPPLTPPTNFWEWLTSGWPGQRGYDRDSILNHMLRGKPSTAPPAGACPCPELLPE